MYVYDISNVWLIVFKCVNIFKNFKDFIKKKFLQNLNVSFLQSLNDVHWKN